MTQYLNTDVQYNDPDFLSALDDMSFWTAPFGIQLLSLVRYRKNIRALDIGFGSGFPLLELAMRLGPTSSVVGIDPWKAAHERTAFKMSYSHVQNVKLVRGAAEHMPFENDSFDLIVSNNGLNNVQDLRQTLSECRRVSHSGSQMVFTFNTNATFAEFYDVFRGVLSEGGWKQLLPKIDDHIYQKRKPLAEIKTLLAQAEFHIEDLYEDEFDFKFSDATAMFHHFFMQIFLADWKELVPGPWREGVFRKLEETLNLLAQRKEGLIMNVPFITINCQNAKEDVWPK